jgi:NTE family protein
MASRLVAALAAFVISCFTFQALSQERPPGGDPSAPQEGRRPKIGLALSGGGARGAAHVGVLKVLDEMRVPVDCIAGTSIGAVVGGLYASGLSTEQIQQWLLSSDWNAYIEDRPPRRGLSFRRKEDDRYYIPDLELGLKGGKIRGPEGLIAGHLFGTELDRLTLPVAQVEDFDRLPIPFRAVATDIVTGEKVVLSRGRLSEAIRASMTIPAVIIPVELDGHLLVDGGLTDNLPVDVVRAMGADVVIAVDVGTPLSDREHLRSLFDVSRQVVNMLTESNVRQSRNLADLLVSPDLSGISVPDYGKMDRAMSAGRAAARAMASQLLPYCLPPEAYAAFREARNPPAFRAPTVDFLRVEGDPALDSRTLLSRMKTRPGKPLDVDQLRRDITRLYDLGDYERVDYEILREGEKTGLVIRTTPKSYGPNYLRFGIRFQDDFEGHSYFDLLANLTFTRINPLGAEWRNSVQFGRTRKVYSEFYQPLEFSSSMFVAPQADYEAAMRDYYAEDTRVAEYTVKTLWAAVDLGFRLGNYGEVRLGPRWGQARAKVDVGPPEMRDLNSHLGGFQLAFVLDQVDNALFPREGTYANVKYFVSKTGMGADEAYEKLDLYYGKYFSRGSHTVFANLAGGSGLGSDVPIYDQYYLGGFLSLSGYRPDQLRGRYFGLLRTGYYFRLSYLPAALGRAAYAGFWLEAGNTWLQRDQVSIHNLRYAATVAVGADTRLGALYVGYGHAKDGHGSVYVSLGRTF